MKKFYVEIEVTVHKVVIVTAENESEVEALVKNGVYVVIHAAEPILLVDRPEVNEFKVLTKEEQGEG